MPQQIGSDHQDITQANGKDRPLFQRFKTFQASDRELRYQTILKNQSKWSQPAFSL